MVTSFKYLLRVILVAYDDWPTMVNNSSRTSKVWSRISLIFSREVAAPRVSGFFFKSMVQALIMSGADTWVVTPFHGKVHEGVSDPGDEMADRTAPAENTRRDVEIYLGGGGKGGGRILDDGGVYQAAAEHIHKIHRYEITYIPM